MIVFSFTLHSFIDIITNSSSELFLCNTKQETKEIKAALRELFDRWNKETLASRQAEIEKMRAEYDPTGEKHYYASDAELYNFDNCFGRIYKITGRNVKAVIDSLCLGWGISFPGFKEAKIGKIPDYFEVEKKVAKERGWDGRYLYPYNEHKEENDKRNAIFRETYDNAQSDWLLKYGEKARKVLIGQIVIESKDDNSIPYDFFDILNETFNATNWHLG